MLPEKGRRDRAVKGGGIVSQKRYQFSSSAETYRRIQILAKRRGLSMGKFVEVLTADVCAVGCCDCVAERAGI